MSIVIDRVGYIPCPEEVLEMSALGFSHLVTVEHCEKWKAINKERQATSRHIRRNVWLAGLALLAVSLLIFSLT